MCGVHPPSWFYTPLRSHRSVRLREKSKKQSFKSITQGGKGDVEGLGERKDRRVVFGRVCNSESLKLTVTFLPLLLCSWWALSLQTSIYSSLLTSFTNFQGLVCMPVPDEIYSSPYDLCIIWTTIIHSWHFFRTLILFQHTILMQLVFLTNKWWCP